MINLQLVVSAALLAVTVFCAGCTSFYAGEEAGVDSQKEIDSLLKNETLRYAERFLGYDLLVNADDHNLTTTYWEELRTNIRTYKVNGTVYRPGDGRAFDIYADFRVNCTDNDRPTARLDRMFLGKMRIY